MDKRMREKRIICGIIVTVFILSLIPLIIVSFYAHPTVDDYSYGYMTYHALKDGGSLLDSQPGFPD